MPTSRVRRISEAISAWVRLLGLLIFYRTWEELRRLQRILALIAVSISPARRMKHVVVRNLKFVESWGLSLLVFFLVANIALSQDTVSPLPGIEPFPAARRDFQFRDRDGNGRLSPEEFNGPTDDPQYRRLKRDFQLLDRDQDGSMSFDEFRTHPWMVSHRERGPMPSRISKRVDELMRKFEKLLPEWDLDSDGELDRTEQVESRFYATFDVELPQRERELNSDTISGRPQVTRVVPHLIDQDNDGVITRAEVRRALEISFGLRRPQGEPVRLESGLVYNWMLFRHCDELQPDDRLTRDDFVTRGYFGDQANQSFDEADRNKDDFVTFEEWCTLPSRETDPISGFMQADTNFDAQLSPEELFKYTPDWQQDIAKHVFPGFDVDGNGWLSLDEYQSTPLCDQVYKWQELRTDGSLNDQLSRFEFKWEPNNYQTPPATGLLDDYFHRYDRDQSGFLSHEELEFITPKPPESRIFRMAADGTEIELLVDNGLLESTYLGSPDLSPDGKSLVFDATPARGITNNFSLSHIVRLELEGPDKHKTFDLGYGNCPDWSPDGKQIAFFVNGGNPDNLAHGVWIANRDGTGRRLLARGLRGPRWSPDGEKILCTSSFGSPHKLLLVDVEKGQRESILNEVVVLGVPDWEPHGKRIAISLYIDSYRSMCLVDLESDPLLVKELWKTKLAGREVSAYDSTRPNWSADGREILFTGNSQLIRVAMNDQQPQPTVVQPDKLDVDINGVWSLDRKQIIYCSTQPLDQVENLKNPTAPFAMPPAPSQK